MNQSNGQKVGYARVSTAGQNLDSQIDALSARVRSHAPGCTKIFSDKESGTKEQRPGWQRLIEYLRDGDILVITELSRMTRSLKHLLQVIDDLENKRVGLISLRENIDTSTATGRFFISIMGAIAQMERELKSERAKAGREAAKARGRSGGRPRTEPQKLEQAQILSRCHALRGLPRENSTQTAAEVCKAVGVGRRSLFRYLAQKRNENAR